MRTWTMLLGLALVGGCAGERRPEPPPPVAVAPEPPPAPAPEPPPPVKPQQTDAGRFRVSVASVDTVEQAQPWVARLEAAGYRTEILAVTIEDRTYQRVLLPGYASLEEAQAVIPFVEQEFGLQGVWVTSRRRAPAPDGAASAPPAQPEATAPAAAAQPDPEAAAPPKETPPAETKPAG